MAAEVSKPSSPKLHETFEIVCSMSNKFVGTSAVSQKFFLREIANRIAKIFHDMGLTDLLKEPQKCFHQWNAWNAWKAARTKQDNLEFFMLAQFVASFDAQEDEFIDSLEAMFRTLSERFILAKCCRDADGSQKGGEASWCDGMSVPRDMTKTEAEAEAICAERDEEEVVGDDWQKEPLGNTSSQSADIRSIFERETAADAWDWDPLVTTTKLCDMFGKAMNKKDGNVKLHSRLNHDNHFSCERVLPILEKVFKFGSDQSKQEAAKKSAHIIENLARNFMRHQNLLAGTALAYALYNNTTAKEKLLVYNSKEKLNVHLNQLLLEDDKLENRKEFLGLTSSIIKNWAYQYPEAQSVMIQPIGDTWFCKSLMLAIAKCPTYEPYLCKCALEVFTILYYPFGSSHLPKRLDSALGKYLLDKWCVVALKRSRGPSRIDVQLRLAAIRAFLVLYHFLQFDVLEYAFILTSSYHCIQADSGSERYVYEVIFHALGLEPPRPRSELKDWELSFVPSWIQEERIRSQSSSKK